MDKLMFDLIKTIISLLKALAVAALVALAAHVLFYLFTGGSPISGAVRMLLG